MSILGDAKLEALLDRLHALSDGQVDATSDFFRRRGEAGELSWDGFDQISHQFMADKLVALDRDKAEFCYLLCRSLGARRVVEAGTSSGVSTLYLAAAVRDNCGVGGGGVVIGTEHEPAKAAAARANFATAGLSEFIDLREGDLRESLQVVGGPVDFMLVDIWVEMARPALERISRTCALAPSSSPITRPACAIPTRPISTSSLTRRMDCGRRRCRLRAGWK